MKFHCGKSAEYHQGPVALGEIANSTSEICRGICPNYVCRFMLSYSIAILDIVQLSHWSISPTTALHIYPLMLGCFLTIFNSHEAIHSLYMISTFIKLCIKYFRFRVKKQNILT